MLIKSMAGLTKIPISTRTRHVNLGSIDPGAQQPFIFRAMGFMTIGAAKDVVKTRVAIRIYRGTTSCTALMAFSMIMVCPVNAFKVSTPFCTPNISAIMATICTEVFIIG